MRVGPALYPPRHKGKVERGLAYVQDNALKGRVFESLAAQNEHLAKWERTVADTRIHGTTKNYVGQLLDAEAREALQVLPPERFPFYHESRRVVSRDGHVEVAKALYSVPLEYVTWQVWARWDGSLVRVWAIEQLQIELVDCDREQARVIGSLREPTRAFGLSLGDRACLALGQLRKLPVVTSDQQLSEPEVGI